MLVDANLLIYAVDASSRQHSAARTWLTDVLNGEARVGLPWLSLAAFVRIATNPRARERPLAVEQATGQVRQWLAADLTWVPEPGPSYAATLLDLVERHDCRGNLVTDAQLAALAIEHGLTVCSTDTDFARFPEIRWLNPLAN